MEIKTSKQIKFISLELRKIHENKPTSESRDKFNKFQYTKWINVEKARKELIKEFEKLFSKYQEAHNSIYKITEFTPMFFMSEVTELINSVLGPEDKD